jgi:hypothetical protein
MKLPMNLAALAAALAFSGIAIAQTPPASQEEPKPGAETPPAEDPRGGFQPTAPLFSAPPQPGQQVLFVPNPQTPTQAYPPPAPLASYPICKRGQFDNCMQRGGR